MKLGLGTVQFGLNYGISNQEGQTPPQKVSVILKHAWDNGITTLDTAANYGDSEVVLGRSMKGDTFFSIVTKTPTFENDKIESTATLHLVETFHKSLKRLNRPNLYGLLIHHANDLLKDGAYYLWEAMEKLKAKGLVQKIGASIYSPAEADKLLEKYPLDIIQLPLNVFDQRMLQNGVLSRLKSRNIEIHCRSIFLQGLLLMTPNQIPSHFNSIMPIFKQYHDDIKEYNISPMKAALSFAYTQREIDTIIIGVNNLNHLEEILSTVSDMSTLTELNFSQYALMEEKIINPSFWKII